MYAFKEIARRTHLVRTKQFRQSNYTYADGKIAGVNAVIPQGQEKEYVNTTKCEWDLLKAKHSQHATAQSIKAAVQYHYIDFSKLRQKVVLFAKTGMYICCCPFDRSIILTNSPTTT